MYDLVKYVHLFFQFGYSQDILSPIYQMLHNNTQAYANFGAKILVKYLGVNETVAKQDMLAVAKFEEQLLEV